MGQDGWCEWITEETSSFSSADESVIKHPDTLKHTHTQVHTHDSHIPIHSHWDVFISRGNVKSLGGKTERTGKDGGIEEGE